ncbi:MAG TPA: 3-deoxy-manno-octulosonate cytidylyltransferase [Myxococcota bacterium]|nr:3-deoxy-manno-octulosonate cytidylyltransferase [Myxococcota bacterium]
MAVLGVIPCRLGASRLPGKPLAEIGGLPMVVRVWQRASAAGGVDRLLVATEDREIAVACGRFSVPVQLTPPCANGTERVLWVAASAGADVVVNIQGDEPLVEPAHIDRLVERVRAGAPIATLCAPLHQDVQNPARVKVVRDQAGDALYFSRLPVPRNGPWWLHLGLYAFGAEAQRRIPTLPPGALEASEGLEQLRWLEAGLKIGLVEVDEAAPGVDTPEDLERVRRIVEGAR